MALLIEVLSAKLTLIEFVQQIFNSKQAVQKNVILYLYCRKWRLRNEGDTE